jgi:endonuclease/exonuclease/phosphatase family metal-dependent hydrolase
MEFNSHPARCVLRAVSLAASIFLVCFATRAQNNVNLRVMAANLNGNTQSYQPFAIRLFQGLKPDVVAIQEFNYTSTNGLGVNTSAAFREMIDTAFGTNFVYFRENGSYNIPNGIISRYPILNSGSWTDTQVSDRAFAWAQIDLPGTNDLYIVSVHLLTSGSTARSTEATNLKALIQANFPANAWIVVAGDFNTDSRTESTTMTTFDSYLSDFPVPVDNNGDSDTSINRNHPHDYVLPSFTMTNYETATVFPTLSYPSGLVFDSRVYNATDLANNFSPVQSADSGLAQHMAVMKDFSIPGTTNSVTTNAPSITAQPQSQSVVLSSNATFTVTAGGTAPLAYQWCFGGTNISGATTNSYSIASVQATNAGNYSVVITNIAGSVTSSIAVLSVITSPVITTNPVPLSVVQGATANFSVAAIGIQPLGYQWRFNGTNISGATTNPYALANVQLTNAGNYSVLVTNSAGSVTSSIAALTVTFAATGTVVMLAGWDMSAATAYGTSPMSPSTNVPVVSVGGLTRGSGVTTAGTAAARTWGGNSFNSTSAGAATTANQFATFTITPNAGYQVSFTALSQYDYKRSTAGPPNGVLQCKVGSGAFSDVTTFSYSSTAGASLGPVDLSGIPALQNVTNTVTFRFVNYGATSSGGNWYIFDLANTTAPDLAVQGIVNTVSSVTNPPAASAVITAPQFNAGQFQMLVTGTATSNYVVQVTTNLSPANWIGQFTNASPFTFTDANLTTPQKFYRAIVQP